MSKSKITKILICLAQVLALGGGIIGYNTVFKGEGSLTEEAAVKLQRLIDALEDNDDVQNVWTNWEE